MDFSDRLNLLPDNVRRKILDSICGIPAVAAPLNADNANDSVSSAALRYSSERVVGNDATKRGHLSPALPDVKLVAGACIVDSFIDDDAIHVSQWRHGFIWVWAGTALLQLRSHGDGFCGLP